MHTIGSSWIVGAFAVVLGVPGVHAAPVDCEAARCAIAGAIDAECPCAAAANHGRYTSCVARVVNRAAREGSIPKRCRSKINGCYIRSLCGKPVGAVLCDRPGDDPGGRCRPLASERECTRRGGDVVTTCCASCDAATPTPTASAATPTPNGVPTASPVATATAAPIATATPTSLATPNAATATTTPTIVATATPIVATATITVGVPTALATATPVPSATVAPPTATATPLPFLFVGVEAEPDTGPPPLRVQWTSDVSGGTPPYTYRWSFGDGSPDATTPNPVHVYERVGDFTTTLVVEDAGGLVETDDWEVTVELD